MRLHAIRLTNFRQHADTSIEFGPGITGVIGPNGTGKTTILEGIAWALYGNEAARGKKDSIRFSRADPRAPVRVELDFELGGHRHRVIRGLTGGELYLDGADKPIANSLTAVTEILQRRIGMTRAEFFNTYFTGQRELGVMTSLGPTERGQFLSRVLGYERLKAAQELVRDRRKELTAELTGVQRTMPDRERVGRESELANEKLTAAKTSVANARKAQAAANASLQELTPRWDAAQKERAARERFVTELRVAESDLAARSREYDSAAAEVAAIDAAVAELATLAPELAPLDALRTERTALDTLAQHDGRRRTLVDAVRAAESELAKLSEQRAGLVDAPRRLQDATTELNGAQEQHAAAVTAFETAHTQWVRDREAADSKVRSLLEQHDEVKTQRDRIVDAGEDGTCPTCQRALGTHFREVLELLDEQLKTVIADGRYFRARVEQLVSKPAEVKRLEEERDAGRVAVTAIDKRIVQEQSLIRELARVDDATARQNERVTQLRTSLDAIPSGYDAERHTAVRGELERLAPLEQRAIRLQARTEQGTQAQLTLARTVTERDEALARATALRAALQRHPGDDAAFESLRAEFDGAGEAARRASASLVNAEADQRVAQADVERAASERAKLAEAEAQAAALTRERRVHEELDLTFAELRTDLNAALRPEVSRVASEFLSELTDGRYNALDLDDNYEIVIVEDGVPKPVISGGEEDVANLALRLAISQMIADRAGQTFSLLALDEVFGSLDDTRRQNVIDLLRALHDRFEQVILITHIDAVNDGCDNVLMVRYDQSTGAAVVEPGAESTVSDAELAEAWS